ncbi:MAG: cytosine permease [Candidatus Methanoglobus sp.]|jgi:purine-cytosine permease-like protein
MSDSKANSEIIEREVLATALPALKNERIYGYLDFIWIQGAFGIGAWALLLGSLAGLTVSAAEAIVLLLVGNCLGLALCAFYSAIFSRYGSEQFVLSRAPFGNRGGILQLLIWIPINFGWIAYCALVFGESMIELLPILWPNVPEIFTTEFPGATLFAILSIILPIYVAYKGPVWIKYFTWITCPLILIIIGGLMYSVLLGVGTEKLFSLNPPAPYGTRVQSFMAVLEWSLGLGFAWAYYWGQYSRLAKSEVSAIHGPWWGWGPILVFASIFCAFGALVTGEYSPSKWLVILGGPTYGAIGLILLILSTLGPIALLIYPAAISAKVAFPRVTWGALVLLVSVPACILFFPQVFYNYNVFLTLIGCLWTAYGAIVLADFYVIRKKRGYFTVNDMRDMYTMGKKFWYHGGFNIAAWIAYFSSLVVYLGLYDPINVSTGFFGWGFPYISGLLAVFLYTFVIYLVLYKLVYRD